MVYGLLKRYLGLLFLSACIIPNLFAGVTQKKEKPVMFQVRKDIKYQVIDNFGASDAWTAPRIRRAAKNPAAPAA